MVGETIAGRYVLEELVGAGGMSSVYRAHDALLERHVALKVLHDYHRADEASIERFRREARAVAQLSHPNIVTVIDRGEEDGRQFIVFEYVEGENLKELVQRSGPLPIRRALEIAAEIGDALAFAHARGLVHRDVKPQNVLLNGDGKAKVTDFGIARSLDVDKGVTQTGTVLGTSNYIAPEQAAGRPVDEQTDVYALGVLAFELLTGDVPFPGENFVAVAMRHMRELPPSVLELRPEAPVRVANAVDRALEKDPADRFASMDDFAAELRACLDGLGADPAADATAIVPARVVREGRRRPARSRRAVWPAVGLVAGLLLLAALTAAVILSDPNPVGGGDAQAEETPSAAVELRAVGTYDPPPGDGEEHDDEVELATDGDPETFWRTSRYRDDLSLQKDGVGLVLDAGAKASPSAIVVRSPAPGFTARIDAGSSPDGPFEAVSEGQQVQTETTFELNDASARYFLVWITEIEAGTRAEISEVSAS